MVKLEIKDYDEMPRSKDVAEVPEEPPKVFFIPIN